MISHDAASAGAASEANAAVMDSLTWVSRTGDGSSRHHKSFIPPKNHSSPVFQ